MAVQTKIQHRRDTAANWTSTNPTLAAGELGFESDTLKFKIGDGSTAWASLKYSQDYTLISDTATTATANTLVLRDSNASFSVNALTSTSISSGTISASGLVRANAGINVQDSLSGDFASGRQTSSHRFDAAVSFTSSGYSPLYLEFPSTLTQDSVFSVVKYVSSNTAYIPIHLMDANGTVFNYDPALVPFSVRAYPQSSVSITAISGSGTYVTYTAANKYVAGQKVTITGATTTAYNLTNATIYRANSTAFIIASAATGATSTATATSADTQTSLTEWKNTSNAVMTKVDGSGIITAPSFVSNVATGTAPFTVTSTTQVANLNAATSGRTVNIGAGAAGSLPYQSAANTTTFLARTATNNSTLLFNSSTNAPYWIQPTVSNTYYAATTSAQLAGVISDETGSGNLVFSTSPTLTTPNIGAATGTSINVTGNVIAGDTLKSTFSSGSEGGQIELTKSVSNTTITTGVTIDVYENRLRFFETGGTSRGYYIDITDGGAGAGTNLVSSGGGGTFNGGTITNALTVSNTSGIDTTGNVTADVFISNNNGNGTNFKIGDDVWIGDFNTANSLRIKGQQNTANAYIVFGDSDATALGRAGTGNLTYGGNTVWHAGNDGSGSGLDADLLEGYHAASTSTANTIVLRDASQNFSANTITANLFGTANLATYIVGGLANKGQIVYQSGVNTTSQLAAPTTNNSTLLYNTSTNAPYWIQPTLSNTYFSATTAAQLINIISNTTGTAGNLVFSTSPVLSTPNIGAATGTSVNVTGQLISTVATGTAPLSVVSTTQVANLNAAVSGLASNLIGGTANKGEIVYQSGVNATSELTAPTTNNSILTYNTSTNAPEWDTPPQTMAVLTGYTSTVTAAGSTTLTNTSTYYQYFTGTSVQTVTLPVTSTLQTGWTFHIVNNSTGNITVNSSGGNLVIVIIPGTTAMVTCIGTTLTTAADWEAGLTDFSAYTGTGSVVMNTSPTLTTPNIGAATGTSVNVTGQLISTNAGAPLAVSNATVVANLASTFAIRGGIGGNTTPTVANTSNMVKIYVSNTTPTDMATGDIWISY